MLISLCFHLEMGDTLVMGFTKVVKVLHDGKLGQSRGADSSSRHIPIHWKCCETWKTQQHRESFSSESLKNQNFVPSKTFEMTRSALCHDF